MGSSQRNHQDLTRLFLTPVRSRIEIARRAMLEPTADVVIELRGCLLPPSGLIVMRQAPRILRTTSSRRESGIATVITGVRPGGNSSMTETSRSAYAVIASVRGMGVAVMIN